MSSGLDRACQAASVAAYQGVDIKGPNVMREIFYFWKADTVTEMYRWTFWAAIPKPWNNDPSAILCVHGQLFFSWTIYHYKRGHPGTTGLLAQPQIVKKFTVLYILSAQQKTFFLYQYCCLSCRIKKKMMKIKVCVADEAKIWGKPPKHSVIPQWWSVPQNHCQMPVEGIRSHQLQTQRRRSMNCITHLLSFSYEVHFGKKTCLLEYHKSWLHLHGYFK